MRLGAYEVLNEVGRGGMGAVLRARAADGRIVAVKVLLRPEARNALERFERERRLLSELGEGFVPILDAGSAPQGPFIVMPFLEGGTLRERLMKQGALPPAETLALGRALAAALARAHERGIVHRDLKPENVLFAKDGAPHIADLGLAKHFDDSSPGAAQSVSLSKTGTFRGTPGYMAPEQMKDAKNAGPPADVFALGAILHECLTGETAFAGETPLEIIDHVERGERRPIATREASRSLLLAIERALDPDPAERFADARALAAALDEESSARAPRGLVALVAVALLLAVGTTGALVAARRPKPPVVERPPEVEAPVDLPAPAADLPRLARGFARSKRMALRRVLGTWAFRARPGPPGPVALAPDGKAALVASDDRAFLFDAETGEELLALPRHGAPIAALAIARDGKSAVTATEVRPVLTPVDEPATEPPLVRVFELPSGRLAETLPVTSAGATALALGDGRIVVGGADGSVETIALAPRARKTVRPASGAVSGVATSLESASPEGAETVAAVGDTLYDFVPGEAPRELKTKEITSLAGSRDASKVAVGYKAGGLRIWGVSSWKMLAATHVHDSPVFAVALSPDERLVATAGGDGRVKVWDVGRLAAEAGPVGSLERELTVVHKRWAAHSLAWSPDGKRLAVRAWDAALHIFDVASGAELFVKDGHRDAVLAFALSPDGKTLYSGGRDDALRAWDAETGKLLSTDVPDRAEVWALTPSADGRSLLVGGNRVCVWDLASRKEIAAVPPPGASFISCSLLPDGERFVGAAVGGHIVLGELATGRTLVPLGGHPPWARHIPVTPRGFVTGVDGGKKVVLRDLDRAAVLSELVHDEPAVDDVLATRSGSRVVALAGPKLLVWDMPAALVSTVHARALVGHEKGLRGVALTSDGKRAATSGRDGTIRLWDLDAGRELDRLDLATASDDAWTLLFDATGRTLYAGTARGVILRYDVR